MLNTLPAPLVASDAIRTHSFPPDLAREGLKHILSGLVPTSDRVMRILRDNVYPRTRATISTEEGTAVSGTGFTGTGAPSGF